MSYELFGDEEATVSAALERLQGYDSSQSEERDAFSNLLENYQKLLKTTRRLIRFSDRIEAELNDMAVKHKAARDEISQKNLELESLSSQLSKYLAPQVYESIFKGKQEVKVESHRKKLTVFFSDIAGFTETADRLESEELTQLLNHYLTEMSQIALAHGATIDKYVGDAIVIFYGDPETHGVKEDALLCAKMAIEMRGRMHALQEIWRATGIENPLQCRMGINTGYCTVGNFGSEARMDYTIIGGGVNLASRLETAAEPGQILASYETYALIKDQIMCEEKGRIQVKGIAHPVAVYEIVDLHENLAKKRHLIHEAHDHFNLDIDLGAMSAQERDETASALRRAIDRLSAGGEGSESRGPSEDAPIEGD